MVLPPAGREGAPVRPPTGWEFLLLALAAWRTWMLLAADTILDPLRDRLLPGRPRLLSWLECPYCAGFWTAAAWAAAYWAAGDWALAAATPFALSAAVVFADAAVDRLHGE